MNTAKALKSEIDLAQSKGEPVPDGVVQQLLQGGIGLVIKLLLLLFDSKNRWKKIVQEVKAAYDSVKAEFETLKAQVQQLLAEIAALKEQKATGSNDALLARLAELETRQTKVDEALEETKTLVANFITGAQ
jgi:cell shape-determining protein MreC